MVLPASQHVPEFIELLGSNRVVIVSGGTGCGKTTQLPLVAQQAFSCKVVCTQPRRAATTTVATRVAEEHGSPLGQHVGYGVRFDKMYTPSTKVLFATEGHLLQTLVPKANETGAIEINHFNGIDILFLDECHEDSKELEIVLFLARETLAVPDRSNFKVVLMSATPDINTLKAYFADFSAADMVIPGVSFPVAISHIGHVAGDTHFVPATPSDLNAELVRQILEHHNDATLQTGDFLVFMPGEYEINNLVTNITNEHKRQQQQQPHAIRPILVIPFHASQAHAEHQLVFASFPQGRKVIVATNIAESSLTIANLKVVFDACNQKVMYFDFVRDAFELRTERACKNALIQRAGRVGRTSPGRTIRMCTEVEFEEQPEFNAAAVTRVPIDDVLLKLLVCVPLNNEKARDRLTTDRFLHPPSAAAQQHALKLLVDLDAIKFANPAAEPMQLRNAIPDKKGRLMSLLPLPTTLAYALLSVAVVHSRVPLAKATSMLSITSSVFAIPKNSPGDLDASKRAMAHISYCFKKGPSDFLTLVNVLHEYQQQEKETRDAWCKKNFVNAHSLREADLVFDQLLNSMRYLKRWNPGNTLVFSNPKTMQVDLFTALLEAYTEHIAVRCRAATVPHKLALERLENGCQNVDDDEYWVVWSGQKVKMPHNSAAFPAKGSHVASSSRSAAIATPPFVMFSETNIKGLELIMFNCSAITAKAIKTSKRFKAAIKKYGNTINPVVRERMRQEGVVYTD
ncbi:P-loop containing nucleoside triphosphate hydrolase protein [Gongronella butleri]|nr:P-loop containing nucleoside triphosphate hydrolase protein [Gongronella butleri]